MLRKLLTMLFILVYASPEAQKLPFRHLTQKQGLSQSAVHAIVQDHQGFMWFGTEDGLNRYDGIRFTVFKDDPSGNNRNALSDRSITALYVHTDGTLWIGTADGGLNLFDAVNERFTAYRLDSADAQSISNDAIYAITRADDQHLWVGTENGLNRFDIRTGKCERILSDADNGPLPHPSVRCLLAEQHTIWMGTFGGGLVSMDLKTKKTKTYLPLDENGELVVRYGNRVRSIIRDAEGSLWVGFDGSSVARFDEGKEAFSFFESLDDNRTSFSGKRASSMCVDSHGVLWIGSDGGLNRFDAEKNGFRVYRHDGDDPTSLSANYVLNVYEDNAQSLWVGTAGGGVSVFHPTLGKFNHLKYDSNSDFRLPGNTVFALEEDNNGRIWVGTIGEGLTRLDFNRQEVRNFDAEANGTHHNVLCINRSRDGKLWFGTWGGGFNVVDPESLVFGEPITRERGLLSGTVLDIQEDRNGSLWIATFKGLCRYFPSSDSLQVFDPAHLFDAENNRAQSLSLPVGHLNSLSIDRKHNVLWIGMEGGGVAKLNIEDMSLRVWTDKDGLGNNSVFHVQADPDNEGCWVGTKTGLSYIEGGSNRVKTWLEADGLQSDYIVGIVADEGGDVWISSNKGLTRFTPTGSGEKPKLRNYTEEDGLQSSEFNQGAVLRTRGGELFFGGINGINRFDPSNIIDNPHAPPVVLTAFSVFGKLFDLDSSITQTKYIELSWRQNFFSFEFAALDFVLPDKNLYSYKMENFDEDWSVPSTRPFASYTGLPGGDYVFMVRAANNDGKWNDEPVRIHIRINPPFWKTTAFYVLISVSAALLLFLLYRWRINKIKREKRILEERVAERTQELAERTEELAEKNKDIMDSINYARKIQSAILPDDKAIKQNFRDVFVLYLPKDVVSGDFYWFGVRDELKVITAVDCTGHGVPGAFMSMIGSNLLSQIVLEKGVTDAGSILEHLNRGVQQALKQGTDAQETNDGMDISLCTINTDTLEVNWAGAYNPLYLIRDGEVQKFTANKYPIGGAHIELDRSYDTHRIQAQKNDALYMFSDGFVDQFGGPQGKKFMGKRFQRLLEEIWDQPMDHQKEVLHKALKDWCGELEQIDDVCVIGVRV